jgi:hypothetical protein
VTRATTILSIRQHRCSPTSTSRRRRRPSPPSSGWIWAAPAAPLGSSHTPLAAGADDLAAAVFVATPPYEENDVEVYDRRGRRQSLQVVDAVPPEESLADPFGEPADDHPTVTTDDRPAEHD